MSFNGCPPHLARATPERVRVAAATESALPEVILFAACCVGEADVVESLIRRHSAAAEWARTGEALYVAAACDRDAVVAHLLAMGFEAKVFRSYNPTYAPRAYFMNGLLWKELAPPQAEVKKSDVAEYGTQEDREREERMKRIDYVVLGREIGPYSRQSVYASPLHAACGSLSAAAVRALLCGGVSASLCSENTGRTALHEISANCRHRAPNARSDAKAVTCAIASALVDSGADVNVRDKWQCTPLMRACQSGNNDLVEVLLSLGADANARDATGATPLHYVYLDCPAIVNALVAAGADVNSQDAYGVSPLMAASLNQGGACLNARVLAAAGADLNVRDLAGRTALHYAVFDDGTCALELIRAGADVEATDARGRRPIEGPPIYHSRQLNSVVLSFVRGGARVDTLPLRYVWDVFFATPSPETLSGLMRAGLDLSAMHEGHTIVHEAASAVTFLFTHTSAPELLRILVAARAPVNTPSTSAFKIAKAWRELPARSTPLHVAAEHAQTVEVLLAAGADHRARDGNGDTAYDVSVKARQWEAVARLLDVDDSIPPSAYPDGYLGWICGDSDCPMECEWLRKALDRGLDANARANKTAEPRRKTGTLLQVACSAYRPSLGCVRLLLERGADITITDADRGTVLEMLFADNAPFSSPESVEFVRGLVSAHPGLVRAPMLHACVRYARYGGVVLARSILRAGVNPNAPLQYDRIHIFGDRIGALTPLHKACKEFVGSAMVCLLLIFGADPNIRSEVGRTAAQYLASWNGLEDNNSMVASMRVVPDPELIDTPMDEAEDAEGLSEGEREARREVATAVHLLAERGADLDVRTERGYTLLHLAAATPHLSPWLRLAGTSAIVNVTNADGQTALHLACTHLCKLEAFRALLRVGADVNARSVSGWTPLHACCALQLPDHVQVLLDAGAGVNAADRDNRTPLHVCAQNDGTAPIMARLLDAGADPKCLMRGRKTAFDLAVAKGWAENIALLQGRKADVTSAGTGMAVGISQTEMLAACKRGDLRRALRLLRSGSVLARSLGGMHPRGTTPFSLMTNWRATDFSTGADAVMDVDVDDDAFAGAADQVAWREVGLVQWRWQSEAGLIGPLLLTQEAADLAAASFAS